MLYAPVPLAPQKNGRAGSNMRENAAFWGHSPREALIDRSDASPALRAAVTHASGGGAATTGAEMGWVVVAATSIAAARHSASACRHSRGHRAASSVARRLFHVADFQKISLWTRIDLQIRSKMAWSHPSVPLVQALDLDIVPESQSI